MVHNWAVKLGFLMVLEKVYLMVVDWAQSWVEPKAGCVGFLLVGLMVAQSVTCLAVHLDC